MRRAVACAVAAGLLVAYGPLVARDPVLSRDDATLIGQVRALGSPLQWPRAVLAGQLLDVQPVRDASFALDLWLSGVLGRGTFHATNLLLWACIAACAFHLMRRAGSPALALAALPLFALHPLFAGSVGWIAARKHLLSCLFALAATLLLMRAIERGDSRPRTALALAGFYALSVLSQPITLLWPIWAALAVWLLAPAADRRRLLVLPAAALPLCALVAVANALYYGRVYPTATGGAPKVVEAAVGVRLLSLGRYAANLVWPSALATQYSPASALNLIGLCALPLCLMLLYRRAPRATLLWTAFAAFPLAVVTLRMTNIFVSDTYALLPAVGAFCALVAALPEGRGSTIALLVLALPAAWLCARQARTWSSDAALWAHAAAVEPSPEALVRHGGHLLEAKDARGARLVAERVLAWDPNQAQLPYLYSRAVAADASLPLEEKIRRLQAQRWNDPWRDYFLGALLAQGGEVAPAADLYRRALQRPQAFKAELPLVAAEAFWLCGKAGLADCGALVAPLRGEPGWSEPRFAGRLAALAH